MTTPPLGLFYLLKSYKAEPPPSITGPPGKGLTNPNIQGVLWRETWERLEQVKGQPDFTWLDTGVAASVDNGKLSSLEVLAGQFCPAWFFALRGVQILNLTGVGPTSVAWDPVFQAYWEKLNKAMASRYDGKLAYTKLGGVGHGSESFVVNPSHPEDQLQADALAVAAGYSDAVTAWKAGVTWMLDMYAEYWKNTPFVLCTGAPFPDGGQEALQAMFDYGNATYKGRFGARADDLTSQSPKEGEPSQTIISATALNSIASGYQFGNHQNANDSNVPERLGLALQRGNGYGAHFQELFADDADDPRSVPVLLEGLSMMTGLESEEPPPNPTVPIVRITVEPPGSVQVIVEV